MYPGYILLFVLAYHVGPGLSLPSATYDQRQTGDVNVQVHVKDVQVLALLGSDMLDDYTEYDYFYDYADFTVKPIDKPTTEATPPASSTTDEVDSSETSDSSSQNTTSLSSGDSSIVNSTIEDATVSVPVDAEEANETLAITSTESAENVTSDENIKPKLKTRTSDKTWNLFEDDEKDGADQNGGKPSVESHSKGSSRKRCRSGYLPNGKGRCRRQSQRRLSLIPLAIKLAPKLFDDQLRGLRNLVQEEKDRNRAMNIR